MAPSGMAMAVMVAAASMLSVTAQDDLAVTGSNDVATAQRWVKEHNIFRCMHGVGKVGWNQAVSDNAQQYVDGLTAMEPSNAYLLAPPEGPAAENQAQGFPNLEAAIANWHEEGNNCAAFPGCMAAKDPNTQYVAHFTAMVWLGVTRIGCAVNGTTGIYICRYWSGDQIGPWTANAGGQSEDAPAVYAKSVRAQVRSYKDCQASASNELDPTDLPDVAALYPAATFIGESPLRHRFMPGTFRTMQNRTLERKVVIVILIVVCLLICCGCVYSCRFLPKEKKGAENFPGTMSYMKHDGHGEKPQAEWRFDRYKETQDERLKERDFSKTWKDTASGAHAFASGRW